MTELLGFALAAAVLATHVLAERRHAAERKHLIQAVIAKNAGECQRLAAKPGEAKAKEPDAPPVLIHPIGL